VSVISSTKGFNNYVIEGDVVRIFLRNRKSEVFETLISLCDLELIKSFNLSWHPKYIKSSDSYYARATQYLGMIEGKPKYKTLTMQSVILRIDYYNNQRPDHVNGDTLDNRRCNLRITTQDENFKNRNGKNKNNTTGYRNVSYVKGKYIVQLQIDGKNTILGKFEDVHEAGKHAEKMRNTYYGEFSGRNNRNDLGLEKTR